MVELADILLARSRIAPLLRPTPLEAASELGGPIWLKLECLNKTRSFKIRGALNAVLSMNAAMRAQGIVAASSGNHAQAVAYAAHLPDLKARILMPVNTPERKVRGAGRYGAVIDCAYPNYDEAEKAARRLEREQGMTFISPYNDPHVIAGAGTIGLEIVESLPDVERVIVSVSGGGLISGIAVAVKALKPACEVIGVSAVSTPALHNLMYGANKPQVWDTLAEALSGDIEAGSITIGLARQFVDQIALVTEEQIAKAMRWLMEEGGWIVEGGGAVGIAALLHDVIPVNGKKTVVVISGGNVDGGTLRRILMM